MLIRIPYLVVSLVTALVLAAIMSASIANAQSQDIAPPSLTSLSFSPRDIDTTASSQSVVVTVGLADGLSGVRRFTIHFLSPSGGQNVNLICTVGNPSCSTVAGDANGGQFQISLTFPQFIEQGEWIASIQDVRDNAGNTSYFFNDDMQDLGLDPRLQVTSIEDTTPPSLTSLSFSPRDIDTSASSQSVVVTVGLVDGLSGVRRFTIHFLSPNGEHNVNLICTVGNPSCSTVAGDSNGGQFQISLRFPQLTEQGEWTASVQDVRDNAGNTSYFFQDDLDILGFPSTITVLVTLPSVPVLTPFALVLLVTGFSGAMLLVRGRTGFHLLRSGPRQK